MTDRETGNNTGGTQPGRQAEPVPLRQPSQSPGDSQGWWPPNQNATHAAPHAAPHSAAHTAAHEMAQPMAHGPYGQYWPGWAPGPPPAPSQPPAPEPRPTKRLSLRQAIPAFVAAAVVVAAGAGVVVGHYAWPSENAVAGAPTTAQHSESGTSGGTSPGRGSGNDNGSAGNSSGSGTGNPNGSAGQGNGGGMLPFGLIPRELLPNGGGTPGSGQPQTQSGSITSAPGAPSDIAGIAQQVDAAVVDINVQFGYQQAAGAGTGIVLTKSGEVLTNNHVIDGATAISVTDLGNGKTYHASVVGYDPSTDVAVLQLQGAKNLATATISHSTNVDKGTPVVGIGNAGGVGGTPSAAGGSVIGLAQSITVGDEMYGTTEHLTGLIETNADIEAGDSGGPLVTSSGTVVGMDTAASIGEAATTSGHEGFAIPIGTATAIAATIESGHGTSAIHVGKTAALGVLVTSGQQSGNSYQYHRPGAPAGSQPTAGAVVAGVLAGGAGAQAGLRVGDVITSFDGHQISSSSDLTKLMTAHHPGDSVKLGWSDPDGQAHTATVTLGSGPAA